MFEPLMHDMGDPVEKACAAIGAVLRQALEVRGHASLMVSGGSSPKPLYEKLSLEELDWQNVTVGLVDERWVNSGEEGSNADFICNHLIQNRAKAARFFGLKTQHATVRAGLSEAEDKFSKLERPFDVCIMGMGLDAHTASWFPNSQGLEAALSPSNKKILCAINAQGSPVAGNHPDRISLTLKAVKDSHLICLFIPNTEKRKVFDSASDKDLFDAPVKALLDAKEKLHIFGSPLND